MDPIMPSEKLEGTLFCVDSDSFGRKGHGKVN